MDSVGPLLGDLWERSRSSVLLFSGFESIITLLDLVGVENIFV